MALPAKELKQRIDAARTLRGLSQRELGHLLEQDGLGKTDVGRLERGQLALRRVHLDALSRHLDLPSWFFTADEIRLPESPEAGLRDLFDELSALRAELALLRAAREHSEPQTPGSQQDPASETPG